ncbi:C-type lectin LmsL-like [Branchiostoma floridae x Branchiostoma belcheri]
MKFNRLAMMTLGLRFKCLLAVLTLCVCWEDGAEAVTKQQLTYIAGRIAEIHGKVNRTSVRVTDTSLSLRAMASRGLPSVHLLTQPTFRHTPVHNVRTTQQPPAVCPAGYRPLVGTCIRLVSQELSHDGARLACLEDGAILAMPKTRELDVALRELVRTDGGNQDYWIGMWEGTGYTDWQWMDGSQLHTYDYQAWNPGEPSNVDWLLWDNCVQYWSEPTGYPLWDDADCFYYKRYICQAARL